jgi:hypothetical protein
VRIRVTTLRSPMSADAVMRALQRTLDGGSFVGRVDQASFRLRQPTASAHGIQPTIRGSVRQLERGAEVRLVCWLHPVIAVAGTTSFFTIAWPIPAAFSADPMPWEAVVISLLLGLSCLWVVASFSKDARNTEKMIGQSIQGRHFEADAAQDQS